MKIEKYLINLASPEPSPGGGSASAMTALLGVSLGMMTCDIMLKRDNIPGQNWMSDYNYLKKAFYTLQGLRCDDETAYSVYMGALKSGNYEAEPLLLKCAEVPASVLIECQKSLEAINNISKVCGRRMISDVVCAVHMLKAAADSSYANIMVNVGFMKEDEDRKYYTDIANNVIKNVNKLAGEIIDTCDNTLKGLIYHG